MKVVIFTSSRETDFEEPVFCDRDSVRVDTSKCTGKSITVAPHVSFLGKYLGWHVMVVDPFAEDTKYEADEIIGDAEFTVSDEKVKDSYVIISTKHVYDSWAITKSYQAGAKAVWVVMSPKRAKVVLSKLKNNGVSKDFLASLRLPAGLDLGGNTEREIALSIVAEMLAVANGASARPLRDIKGIESLVETL